ncbi:MAG: porin family protein [Bacteroidia bacterium]
MKRCLSLLIIICLGFSLQAQNRFKGGLRLGISTSQVEGDGYRGFHKFGLAFGPTLTAKISDKWDAQFEMLFIQKGSQNSSIDSTAAGSSYNYYRMSLNYLEVPFMLNYKQKKFTFELGLSGGVLISAKEENAYGEFPGLTPFKRYELACIAGVHYQLFKKLGFTWRYSNSILPIRDYQSGASFWFNPGQINVVLALTATYQFGKLDDGQ